MHPSSSEGPHDSLSDPRQISSEKLLVHVLLTSMCCWQIVSLLCGSLNGLNWYLRVVVLSGSASLLDRQGASSSIVAISVLV